MALFDTDEDYAAFDRVLAKAVVRDGMRLLAYCVMPNHFYLFAPRRRRPFPIHAMAHRDAHPAVARDPPHCRDRPLESRSVQVISRAIGRAFPDMCRYVERNPLRANLVKRAQDWNWSSLSARQKKHDEDRP